MGLFYKVSNKELVKIRNKIFLDKGMPALTKNGFQQSPFSGSWFGKDDYGGYSYELCRPTTDSCLEMITVDVVSGDKWIKVFLNIFKLEPELTTLEKLNGIDGIQFDLPPNSITKMRLRIDDFKGMPLFRTVEHKLGSYYSKAGFESRIKQLGDLIEKDMTNIDYFVKRWHEVHGKPMVTDWQGHPINK